MRRWICISALLASTACSGSTKVLWSLDSVTNTDEGILLVWQRAENRGGEFNGFDNSPVISARATYEACKVSIPALGRNGQQVPVKYSYNSDQGAEPAGNFFLAGDAVLPSGCASEGDRCVRSKGFSPLGSREGRMQVGVASAEFFLGEAGASCSIKISDAGGREQSATSMRYRLANLVATSTQIVADLASPGISVESFHTCNSATKVDSVLDRLRASGLAEEQTRDIDLVDVAATREGLIGIVGWRDIVGGASLERFGVLDFTSDSLTRLPDFVSRPIGFYGLDPTLVLLRVEGDANDNEGTAKVTLFSVPERSLRTESVTCKFRS